MFGLLLDLLPHIATATHVIAAIGVSAHAILTKPDPRSALGWVGLAWLAPLIGSLLYLLLGINRVSRRGARLQPLRQSVTINTSKHMFDPSVVPDSHEVAHLKSLATLGRNITERPLLRGNAVTPLQNGDETYSAMVAAIDAAKCSVALSTYILKKDRAGTKIIEALKRARARHLQVRVIVDGIGAGYFLAPAIAELRMAGIPAERFLHSFLPWRMPFLNMRTHKKILVVDGRIGFTGGINISEANLHAAHPRKPVQDTHFRIEGPVVSHMAASFAEDWLFVSGEELSGDNWFPAQIELGNTVARGISSGPDEDIEKLQWVISGAIGRAKSHIKIVTPYFLPDQRLISALTLAALRGVRVDIVLPAKSNHPIMDWAAYAQHAQVLKPGCRIHLSKPPFDHSKLMTVDGDWALIGSANWDTRSLRLNFEYNVECYDLVLVPMLDEIVDAKIGRSRRLALSDLASRHPLLKIRDGIARLLLPYL